MKRNEVDKVGIKWIVRQSQYGSDRKTRAIDCRRVCGTEDNASLDDGFRLNMADE